MRLQAETIQITDPTYRLWLVRPVARRRQHMTVVARSRREAIDLARADYSARAIPSGPISARRTSHLANPHTWTSADVAALWTLGPAGWARYDLTLIWEQVQHYRLSDFR